MSAGTPQGAVLSPTLFNIFVDDVREVLGEGVSFAQYADDLAIWVRDACPKKAERMLNEKLQRLSVWTNNWRIKLAPEKSASILFSRRPTHRRLPIELKLMGEDIARNECHKFLGVMFDDKLNWRKHVEGIIGGVTARIHALKRLSAKSTFSNPKRIMQLHEALVNSVFKYGSVAYAGMSDAMWDRLQKCHAGCVKAYVGMPNYVSYSLVCDTLGVKKIKEEILDFARKRIIAMINFSPLSGSLIKRCDISSQIYKSASEAAISNDELDLLVPLV